MVYILRASEHAQVYKSASMTLISIVYLMIIITMYFNFRLRLISEINYGQGSLRHFLLGRDKLDSFEQVLGNIRLWLTFYLPVNIMNFYQWLCRWNFSPKLAQFIYFRLLFSISFWWLLWSTSTILNYELVATLAVSLDFWKYTSRCPRKNY